MIGRQKICDFEYVLDDPFLCLEALGSFLLDRRKEESKDRQQTRKQICWDLHSFNILEDLDQPEYNVGLGDDILLFDLSLEGNFLETY
jgi:hypothetical protein